MVWNRLKGLFAPKTAGSRDDGIYLYVGCGRCDDRVRVRLNPSSDLQHEFGESGEGVEGYSVRKMVVDQRCFRPIEVRIRFDAAQREKSREIDGGAFLSREEYESETRL